MIVSFPNKLQIAQQAISPTMKQFSSTEIARHSTPSDAWIVISNKVYNVTSFLDMHPGTQITKAGGSRVMLPFLGKDATAIFNQYHKAQTVMAKYSKMLLIGEVEGSEPDAAYDPEAEMFGDLVAFGDPSWYQGWKSPYYNVFSKLKQGQS